MAKIYIQPNTLYGQWNSKERLFLRWKIDRDVITSDNDEILAGSHNPNLYGQIELVIDGSNLVFREIVIDSTTDSSDPKAKYDFTVHKRGGGKVFDYKLGCSIPHELGNEISWQTIKISNGARKIYGANTDALNAAQTAQMIQSQLAVVVKPPASQIVMGMMFLSESPEVPGHPVALGANDSILASINRPASDLQLGALFLDTEPDNPNYPVALAPNSQVIANLQDALGSKANFENIGGTELTKIPDTPVRPIAVGANESVYTEAKKSQYLVDAIGGTTQQKLNAALTELGSNRKPLVISDVVSVTSTTTIPQTAELKIIGAGKFTVAASRTLTTPQPDVNRRVFSGNGSVIVKNCPVIKLIWFQDPDSNDITWALKQCRASLVANKGGKIELPDGAFVHVGALPEFPSNTLIDGAGHAYDETGVGTKITLVGDGIVLFTIGELTKNVRLSNLSLDGTGTDGSTGVQMIGTAPNTSIGVHFHNVNIQNFAYGIDIFSETSTAWQIEKVDLTGITILGCNKSIQINTNNSSLTLIMPYIDVPSGGTALELLKVGVLNIIGHNEVSRTGGDTFLHVVGDHLGINVYGGQGEGISNFIVVDVPQITDPINIFGTLIQGAIFLNQSCILNLIGCRTYGKSVFDDAGAAAQVYLIGGHGFRRTVGDPAVVENLDGSTDPLATARVDDFVGGSKVFKLGAESDLYSLIVGNGSKVSKILRGTVSIDPPNVPANSEVEQTYPLTGALAGDTVVLNVPSAGLTAGLEFSNVRISATDTLKIKFKNTTGADINNASGSWVYRLER